MAVSQESCFPFWRTLTIKSIFIEDGLDIFQDLQGYLGPASHCREEHRLTRASTIVSGSRKLKAGKKDNLDDLVPFYIRASAAETRWKSNEKA